MTLIEFETKLATKTKSSIGLAITPAGDWPTGMVWIFLKFFKSMTETELVPALVTKACVKGGTGPKSISSVQLIWHQGTSKKASHRTRFNRQTPGVILFC